jgi:hypothetical protein
MDDNTTKLIADIAEKLGTTAEKLWPVLVRSTFINHLVAVVCCGLVLALISLLFAYSVKRGPALREFGRQNGDMPAVELIYGCCIVAAIIVVIFLSNALPGLIYPDGRSLVWLIHGGRE